MRFEGKQTQEPKQSKELLPHGPDNVYFTWEYIHSPKSWEIVPVMDKETGEQAKDPNGKNIYEWLPVLKPFFHQPGLNGVKTGKKGTNKPDIRVALVKLQEEGWVRIPWESFPGGYIVEYEGMRGIVYGSVFAIPTVVGEGPRAVLQWDYDSPNSVAAKKDVTYNDFRRSLVEKGVIPEITRSAIRWRLDLAKNRAKRWHKHAHIPAVAERIERNSELLDAVKNTEGPKTKGKKNRTED